MRDYNFAIVLVGILSIMTLGVAAMSSDVMLKMNDLYIFTGIVLALTGISLAAYLKDK